jgi:drug/metabolite transporter (DMT)-like permease
VNFYIPIAVLVLSVIIYQMGAKLAPQNLNPFHLMIFVYSTGILMALILSRLEGGTLGQTFKQTNWGVWLMGLSVVGIELGYLLAFRAGWKVSLIGITSSVAVASLMLPIGLLVFREKVSVIHLLGLVLCVAGLLLVTRR